MTTGFTYAFQPQPPSVPKTNAGKRGPSLPIAILSPSDDSESDVSITDFSPPSNNRSILTELPKASIPALPSPRSHVSSKKQGLSLSNSPRLSVNNNNNVSNSSPVNSGSNIHTSGVQSLLSSNSQNTSGYSHIGSSSSSSSSSSPSSSSSSPSLSSSAAGASSPSSSSLPQPQSSSSITLPTPASLTKSLPPAISIPPQTSATGIPALSTSALSPTASSQSANNNSNSSSHDSHKENSNPSASPRERSCSPSSNFAYEHDHDYENVASPCSSTASGPTYIRPAGFQHHAQEFIVKTKPKKKKTSATLLNLREGFKKREATPPKLKPKREPLPMKLRALPQSFWQQPNAPQQVSPASNFPILPPLCHRDSEEAMDERPVTPPEDHDAGRKLPECKITVADPNLLFKLFEGIGDEKKSNHSKTKHSTVRHKKAAAKTNANFLFNGNDPYLMEDVTEKIFPQLNLEGRKPVTGGGNPCLQLITLKDGDRDVTLPSLSMEQNYPQMLSELVMHI